MAHKIEGGRGNPMNQKLLPEQTEISATSITGAMQNQNFRARIFGNNVTCERAIAKVNPKICLLEISFIGHF
jgi:hypothetical protein